MTDPRADGLGVSTCIEAAIRDARIEREQVNYINAHATRCVGMGDVGEGAVTGHVAAVPQSSGILSDQALSLPVSLSPGHAGGRHRGGEGPEERVQGHQAHQNERHQVADRALPGSSRWHGGHRHYQGGWSAAEHSSGACLVFVRVPVLGRAGCMA
eukprot:1152626-Pelagomonas_calceolata.AAC.2